MEFFLFKKNKIFGFSILYLFDIIFTILRLPHFNLSLSIASPTLSCNFYKPFKLIKHPQ